MKRKEDVFLDGEKKQEEIEAIKEEIPACRLGTPGETAGLVCQLAESSSYLTGQVIKLDGGWI